MSRRRRKIKPKTVRRLLLLGAVVVLAAVAAFGVFWVRGWQQERQLQTWRRDGMADFEKGKHYDAIQNLSKYLRRRRQDAVTLVAFAQCRENVPESDGRHLREAKTHYEEARALDATLRDAGLRLLRLYIQLEHYVEARELAPRLRPAKIQDATDEDAEVLTLEAQAARAVDDEAAFAEIVNRLLELREFPVHVLVPYVATATRAGRTGDVDRLVRRYTAAFPGDPRSELMRLVALGVTGSNDDEVFVGICYAFLLDEQTAEPQGEVPLADKETALMVVGLFDMLTRPEHAYSMILAGLRRFPDDETLAGLAARRGWQRGDYARVIAQADAGNIPSKARADVLVFKALSLLDTGRGADVPAVVAQLEELEGDFSARAWVKAINALVNRGNAGDRATLVELQAALDLHPFEPVLAYLTGDTLARLQRFDEARDKWRSALSMQLSAGWIAPALRGSETLLMEARAVEALDAAQAAAIASTGSPQAVMAWIETETAALQQDLRTREQAQLFLTRVEALLKGRPEQMEAADHRAFDRLEISRIVALARVGRRDEAVAAATGLLNRTPPVDSSTLDRLAILSQHEALGLGRAALELAGDKATPAVGLSAALEYAARGDPEAGEAVLQRLAEAAPAGPVRQRWDQALAQYGELVGGAGTLQRWRDLVQKYPQEADVLRTALAAPSLARDPAFINEIAQKFYTLTGATEATAPAYVQVARARSLLSGDVTKRGHQEAVVMLNRLVASSPRLITARELLIQALVMNKPDEGIIPDLNAAMTEIDTAAEFASRPSVFLLSGAALMQGASDYIRAGKLLHRVLDDPASPLEARVAAASMLVRQGDYNEAIKPLEAMVREGGETPDTEVLWWLARAYRATSRESDALATFRRMADAPLTDVDMIVHVAGALAVHRDTETAQRVAERLTAMDLPRARMLVAQGRYAELSGDRAGGVARYEEAVAADPKDSTAWQFLVQAHLAAGNAAAAQDALARAVAVLPDDPEFAVLEQRIVIDAAQGGAINLQKLAEALKRDPARARAAAAVAALEAARRDNKLGDAAALRVLAGQFKDVLAMQAFVARRLLEDPAVDPGEPQGIAETAMRNFPTEPEAARLAVEVAASQERWADMEEAASAWRERDTTGAMEIDLALADARVHLGRYREARADLEPHVHAALAGADQKVPRLVLQTYARALIEENEEARAHDLLRPALTNPGVLEHVWVPLAALTVRDPVRAEAWLAEAGAALPAGDEAARLAVARGYTTLAGTFPERAQPNLTAAMTLLEGAESPESREVLGLVQMEAGRTAEATATLTAVLKDDPARPDAVAALCELLAGAGRAGGAVAIAQRAFDLKGPEDGRATLNLARAHTAAAESAPDRKASLTKATELFLKAANLLPRQLDLLLDAATAAEGAGDARSAVLFYERALRVPGIAPELAANIRNNAAYGLLSVAASREDLSKARQLASDASRAVPHAAHFDTLARIEAALGTREAAVAAYRQALQLDPNYVSARLGLAALLLERSNGRAEAGKLLEGLDEKSMSESQRAELGRLRERLAR